MINSDEITFSMAFYFTSPSFPRCIAFGSEGDCVFAGCHDLLKVYGWEPFRSFDTVAMGWGKIADIAVAQTQLVRDVGWVMLVM